MKMEMKMNARDTWAIMRSQRCGCGEVRAHVIKAITVRSISYTRPSGLVALNPAYDDGLFMYEMAWHPGSIEMSMGGRHWAWGTVRHTQVPGFVEER